MLDDFDQTVAEFMADFGGPASFLIAGAPVRDLDTGDVTFPVQEYAVEAILLDFALKTFGLQTDAGTLIQAGDKQVFVRPFEKKYPYVAMPEIDPSKDKFKMGGNIYKIVTLKQANPSSTNNVMFELYVRR